MIKLTVIFRQFDIVSVPFPFTEKNASKKRPALVLSDDKSFNTSTDKSVMAMITSADHTPWPLDIHIRDLKSAGLPSDSIVRMKLFTLDHFLIFRLAGHLSELDANEVRIAIKTLFQFKV